jgi:hypothetical protein
MYFFSNSPVKWRLTKVVYWMRQLAVVDEPGRVPLLHNEAAFAASRYSTPGKSRGSTSLNVPFLYLHRRQARA